MTNVTAIRVLHTYAEVYRPRTAAVCTFQADRCSTIDPPVHENDDELKRSVACSLDSDLGTGTSAADSIACLPPRTVLFCSGSKVVKMIPRVTRKQKTA